MRVWLGGPRIMGLRTGVSFGPSDLRRMGKAVASRPAAQMSSTPELIYVIRNGHGEVKVGVSGDPLNRRAELQTGSSTPLEIVYAAAVRSGNAFPIETSAKAILGSYSRSGEWFATSPAVAVAAIAAASHELGDSIVEIAKENLRYAIDRARAADAPAARPNNLLGKIAVSVYLALVALFIVTVLFLGAHLSP